MTVCYVGGCEKASIEFEVSKLVELRGEEEETDAKSELFSQKSEKVKVRAQKRKKKKKEEKCGELIFIKISDSYYECLPRLRLSNVYLESSHNKERRSKLVQSRLSGIESPRRPPTQRFHSVEGERGGKKKEKRR